MRRLFTFAVIIAFGVLVSACGTQGHSYTPRFISTDSARDELAAMQPPQGVNPAIFERLRAALDSALAAKGGKAVAAAPGGEKNCVHDISLIPLGAQKVLGWGYRNSGDYDQSGTVGVTDVTPIAMHFGHNLGTDGLDAVIHASPGGPVGVSDVTPIAMNFGVNCDHYSVRVADTQLGTYAEIGTVAFAEGTGASEGWKRFEYTFTPETSHWYCVVPVDAQGNEGIASDPICSAPGAPPEISVISPLDAGISTTVFFTAIVTGAGPLTYDWQFGAAATPSSSTDSSPQVTLAAATGVYSCSLTVTNDGGEDTVNFDLTLGAPPDITSVTPQGGSSGDNVQFNATVDGTEPFDYDWQFGGGASPDSSLEIEPMVTLGAQGSYSASVAVINDYGSDFYEWTLDVGQEAYDEVEPNNDSTQANALPTKPFSGFFASIGPGGYDGGTSDWFSFSAAAGDQLRIVLETAAPMPDITLDLLDTGMVIQKTATAASGKAIIFLTAFTGADYFLNVTTAAATSDYHLAIEVLDFDEKENNDGFAGATVLPHLNVAMFTGNIGTDGIYDGDYTDYMMIDPADNIAAGDEIHAALLLIPPIPEVKLELVTMTGGVLASSDTDDNEAIGYTVTPADTGPFFILVSSLPAAGSCNWGLTVQRVSSVSYDEVEDNDALANANDLPGLPFWGYTGNCGEGGYDGDRMDYFNLPISDLAVGDTLTVDMMCSNGDADLQVVAYDMTDTIIATSTGDGVQERLTFTITSPMEFPFYIEIRPATDNAQNSDYWLDVNNVQYDETEPNDDTDHANELPPLNFINISGNLDSHSPTPFDWLDYWTFNSGDTISTGDTLVIHVDYSQINVHSIVYLWDGDLDMSVFSDSDDGTEDITYTIQPGDIPPYYVDIRVQLPDVASNYLLDVSKQ
jgi:PKD repeat protein